MTGMHALRLAAMLMALVAVACAGGDDAATSPTPEVLVVGGSPSQTAPPSATATKQGTPTPSPTRAPVLVSLDWLAGDAGLPDAGPISAPARNDGLEAAVEAGLTNFAGEASVAVWNLADGRYAALDESRSWYAASTFKAALLLAAYQQRDAGALDFDKIVTVEEKYAENDLGTLEYLGIKVNDQITVRDAIKGMIVVSDTSLAALVQDQLGGNVVDSALREIGATVMTVNSRDLPTTASDLTQLLVAIVDGHGVSAASRDEMLSLLAREWYTSGIIAGLPAGTQYAHKSGTLGAATHDAAIVWGPEGPYIIVVMTDGSGGWEPIAAVSAAVWNYFATP